MRKSPFWWILMSFMLLVDIYFFQALQVVSYQASLTARIIIYSLYWLASLSAVIVFWALPYIKFKQQAKLLRTSVFSIIAGLFFAKLLASVIFLANDIYRFVLWIGGNPVSRSYMMSWAGIITGAVLFGILIYGFSNKYRYKIKRIKLHYNNLPDAFKGLKIVHISDIHSGSFTDKNAVIKGVEKIMNEKADLILFTGDLVNNVADEMKEYMDVFDKLKAPLGVYSTLGNHDYGDYVHWKSEEEKKANLEKLKQVHSSLGWRLLMNEYIVLERGTDKIAVIGIENWSAKARFH